MNTQRGNTTIIIISVVLALLFFIVAGSIGGYFVYKYYFAEEEKDSEKESSGAVTRDEEGFIDCGRSISSLEDFDDPFFGIDFDKDNAFACMGKNIKDNCSKAKSVINVDGIDLVYKITGSNGFNCKAKFEVEDPKEGLAWAECPLSSLMSFAQDQAVNVQEFQMIIDKMEDGNGDYGASIFALMALALNLDLETSEQLGCTRNND